MNSSGNIVEEYNYDPWGRRRNPTDWSYSNVSTPTYTQHGFTGHACPPKPCFIRRGFAVIGRRRKHLDMFNLINMNGRIYDSEIARFLSPDPIIQSPYNLLNYNRYSYCLNNPLKYTDPSGYDREAILRDMEREQFNDPGPTQFYNNYPAGWEEFQDMNSKHYFISVPSESGKPRVTVEIRFTPSYSWGRYEIQVRVYSKMYNEFNFMQTKSYEGEQSVLDRAWEYNNGFYYNNDDLNYYSDNHFRQGSDGYFHDRPNASYFDAELTIFGKRNNYWENIQTYSWGYSILNGMLSHEYFKLNSNPSTTHQYYIRKVLNQWNNR